MLCICLLNERENVQPNVLRKERVRLAHERVHLPIQVLGQPLQAHQDADAGDETGGCEAEAADRELQPTRAASEVHEHRERDWAVDGSEG